MTTLTVEIDKAQDLSALKDFIGQLGLKYQVDQREGLLYTDEVKMELDKRYASYKNGAVEMVKAEESRAKIQTLLTAKNK